MSLRKIKAWSAAVALSVLCAPSMAAWPEDQTIELVVGFAPRWRYGLNGTRTRPIFRKKTWR
jgi:hypothetical protein